MVVATSFWRQNARSRTRFGLALGLTAAVAGCTGSLDSASGPTRPAEGNDSPSGAGRDASVASSADAEAPGEQAAGIGTQIFASCKGGKEKPGPRLLRLLTRREYKNTVQDLLSLQAPDVSTLPLEARVRGFDNNAKSQAVTSRHVDAYLALSEALAKDAVEKNKGALLQCDPNQSTCVRTFLERFGLRAFRRPLSSAELDRYAQLFATDLTQGKFDDGMKLAIQAILSSPSFLYRSEVGSAAGDGTFKLSPYEIASALSYLYWGSMPDQALFDAAKNDQLKTPEQLRTQAARMLNDNKAKEQLGEFSIQWLRSEAVLNANKDKDVYPNFRDSLRTAMIEEQKRFFARVVLEDKGKFEQLFTPDYTLVNKELAAFYALPMPGNDYDKVSVGDSGRGGVLGLGAVLASHAHQNESSPIKRGLFVRDRLLCQVLPQPDPSINTTPPGLDPKLTTRERFAKHTSDAKCKSCHQYIDGVGFGFEGFDGVGQQRKVENNLAVNTSGEILGIEQLGDGSKQNFDGPRALATLLRDSDNAKACLSLQYYRFGRGYEERESDACSLSALAERFKSGGYTVRDLLENLPLLTSFTVRAAE
jgi:hypothetical protein